MVRRRGTPAGPLQRLYEAQRLAEEQSTIDVLTPEQRAKGCYTNQGAGRRYFRLRHVDRLHRNGKLTYEQHQAATWYRDQWDRGRYDNPTVSDYTRPRGENTPDPGLKSSQQMARDKWRVARTAWPADMVGFMDALLLRDRWPSVHHRERARTLDRVRGALDAMARHLRILPLDRAEHFEYGNSQNRERAPRA